MYRTSQKFRHVAVVAALALFGASSHLAAAPAAADVSKTYADIAEAVFTDSLDGAKALDKAIAAFLAAPADATLKAARAAWVAARVPYLQSETFRFGNSVVDDWEGKVNSWPLDEGLIDYVDKATYGEKKDENPLYTANIIANTSLRLGADVLDAGKIDKALIAKLNAALEVDANVGTGYHAIEFLLWGQDLNGTGPGAGNRPASDYDLKACSNGNCDRRRDYLKAAAELLVDDMSEMAANWGKGGKAREEFMAKPEPDRLAAILTGIGSLSYGELAGERMKLGVLLHDTEEEQDCFSDNTHNSHFNDQVGMMAVWSGRYEGAHKVSGPGIRDLALDKAPDAARRVDEAMAATLGKLKAIKDKAETGGMAYDQMLAAGNDEGNKLILDGSAALVAQTRAIEAVVAGLNLKIKLEGSKSLDAPDEVGKP